VGLADATLRSARAFLHETLAESWQRTLAGQPSSLAQRADLLLAAAHAMQSSVRVVELMHRVAGTSGIYAGNRLERHFRDAGTLRQHVFFRRTATRRWARLRSACRSTWEGLRIFSGFRTLKGGA
jgi:alkylation response protein AidB-like acyl-CoA dehydrogenase